MRYDRLGAIMLNNLACVLTVLAVLLSAVSPAQTKRGVLVLHSAELLICGQTNIGDFNCRLIKTNLNDTLAIFDRSHAGASAFEGLEIAFEVADFGCDVSLMTRDFRRLLQSQQFPKIWLKINEIIVEKESQLGDHQQVTACVDMRITDIEREVRIEEATIIHQNQYVVFSGNHEVMMTSFNIDPPTRLFGTVRTQDLLEILFTIEII